MKQLIGKQRVLDNLHDYADNASVSKNLSSHGHPHPGMHVLTKPFAMKVLAARIGSLIEG